MKFLHEELAKKYNYTKLPQELSNKIKTIYAHTLPEFIDKDYSRPLYTLAGTLICNGFDRIVIGDYGAYIEFSDEQAAKDNFIIAPKQEYRLEPRYSNVKYIWLTAKDNSDVKIYFQKNTVSYADYIPRKYYVSVYEVYPMSIQLEEN